MAEAYDLSFRERAVAAYHAGAGGYHGLARLFGIVYRTLERWVARAARYVVRPHHCRQFFRPCWICQLKCLTGLGKIERPGRRASSRTMQLYDRRSDEVTLDEVERDIAGRGFLPESLNRLHGRRRQDLSASWKTPL
jgi:hypothetical protein